MTFATKFSQVEQYQSGKLRQAARYAALDLLSLKQSVSGATAALKLPRVQFLYIHHCFEDEVDSLDRLLSKLANHFSFITYSEAVNRVLTGDIDKPYLAFSSDDGFRNNLHAAKILEKYGTTACFFVNPALIGETDHDQVAQHCAEKLHFPPVEFLSWKEVEELEIRGHEIGAHTLNHMNMAQATEEEIAADLQVCRELLSEHCKEVQHFAYPYGRFHDFSENARKLVFESGFASCASAERGCHVSPEKELKADQLCIRRDHILLKWKWSHIRFFLVRNAQNAHSVNNEFPGDL